VEELHLKTGLNSQNKVIFDFVFQYYYSGLCTYAETIVKNQEVAEDIVQELFVKLWVKAKEISIKGSLKNYLFTSIRNRCFDFLKHQTVKSKLTQLNQYSGDVDEFTPENWLVESEIKDIIEQSIEKLAPRCQEIFRLSRFQGLKNQEIADKLGLSKRTVEIQITNALKTLRKDLKPYLPIFLLAFL
jgi:RNA polymerase sigma-70 factor (ECF subfamily)